MGVSYIAVACSLDALASLYGARDEALFGRVVHSDDPCVLHYLRVACRGGHRAEATRAMIGRVGASFHAEDDAISLELLNWLADCYAGAARRGSDLLLVVH